MLGKVERIRVIRNKKLIKIQFERGQIIDIQERHCMLYLNRLTKQGFYSKKIDSNNLQKFVKKARSIWVSRIILGKLGIEKLVLEINI